MSEIEKATVVALALTPVVFAVIFCAVSWQTRREDRRFREMQDRYRRAGRVPPGRTWL